MPALQKAKTIGYIKGKALSDLESWMRSLKLDKTLRSNYAPDRLERWFGWASNLMNPKTKGRLFKTDDPPQHVIELGDSSLPGWHSVLVCGGDTSIDWHRDHGHFEGLAVMVNIGRAVYYEQYGPDDAGELELTNGQVVLIETKLLHKAEPISCDRMHLTYRRIKAEYLPLELSPLFQD